MVTRDTAWPDGTPCWADLGTADIPRAISFYSSEFGWDIQVGGQEVGGYSLAILDGRQAVGIGPVMGPPGTPSAWTTYLATSDADVTAGKIKRAGGQLLTDVMDVMDLGRMAIASDITGAAFGIWQARKHTGAQVANVPGAFTWAEHMSHDFEGAKAFYAAVFGYDFGDMSSGGFSYATLLINGKEVGGIGAYPGEADASHRPFWSVYFGTADTDKSVEAATGHGGQVIRPASDSPYGRMAVVADDQGAVFSLISVSAES
jgi:predicted enzyme related to lactoylglutathione lyase